METTTPQNKDLLRIKTFSDVIKVTGCAYWDSYAKAFTIIRLPVLIRHTFPLINKRRVRYEIRCFPSTEALKAHLDSTPELVPLVLNLFEREDTKS